MLSLQSLHVKIAEKSVLQDVSATYLPGKVYVVLGVNGSGKSSLAHTLLGHPDYHVINGTMMFQGQDLASLSIEMRARMGIFVAFQSPVSLDGVQVIYLLKAAIAERRLYQGLAPLDAMDVLSIAKEACQYVGLSESFLNRYVNVGFSGGEKKRLELLFIKVLYPNIIILDEIDSGLDAPGLDSVTRTIQDMRHQDHTFLIISHRIDWLKTLSPDHIAVIKQGHLLDVVNLEQGLAMMHDA
jgi:Fe-S cluster assembly ATP-binding protein